MRRGRAAVALILAAREASGLPVLLGGGNLNLEFVRGIWRAGCSPRGAVQGRVLLPEWMAPLWSPGLWGQFACSCISRWCPRVDEGTWSRGGFCGWSLNSLPPGQSNCGPGVGVS